MASTTKILLFFITFIIVSASVLAQTISITPVPANDNDDLTCLVDGVNDPTFIYQWDRLGVADSPIEANPLDASNTRLGDNWRCKVFVPSFPIDIPVPGFANVTVSGEPVPEVTIRIVPDPAYDNNNLTCLANGVNNPMYIYHWDRVGVADSPIEANPLDAVETAVGETWRCKILVPSFPEDIPVPGSDTVTIQPTPRACSDPDRDGFGVGDECLGPDNCPDIANPAQADFDGDNAGDACDADNDNDGVDNGADNCPLGDGDAIFEPAVSRFARFDQNPDQTDADGDDVGNLCDSDNDNDGVANDVDNCRFVANPGQENLDGDSAGDACDLDDDNDGVNDDADNCPVGNADGVFDPMVDTIADQTDSDGDGVGDLCDPDVACFDIDGDGFGSGIACAGPDNCPVVLNPDQADLDADGVGDACDADKDNDRVDDGADNCPLGDGDLLYEPGTDDNPDQTDSDSDGLGDVCDVVDVEPPIVILNTPADDETVRSSTVDFTYFVVDDVDTFLTCTLYTDVSGAFMPGSTQTAHHLLFDVLTDYTDLNTFTLTDVPDGIYHWNVECVDAAGNRAVAPDEFTFIVNTTISGTSPVVSITADPAEGEAPLDVSFTADVDGGDGVLRYRWSFGDGSVSDERSPLHFYEEDGTYTTMLTVTDADGDSGSASVVIHVGTAEAARGDELTIRRISLIGPAGTESAYAGSELVMRITLENNGHRALEDVSVSLAIPELGVRRHEGTFDLSIGETDTAVVRLEIPDGVEPGEYDVHIAAGNDEVQRFRNRFIDIIEPYEN